MKIISLRAENIKRLKAVQVDPEGNLVQITGANGQGKTSVLDAIWWALQGTKTIQKTPIRDGEESALIKLDLGEYLVTRTFTAKEGGDYTTKLKVSTPDGAVFSSPQDMLNKMFGELTFDPLAFTRMKPAEQVKSLQLLAPDFDFEANSKASSDAYDERRRINREVSDLEGAIATAEVSIPENPPKYVDPADLIQQFKNAVETNGDIERRMRNRKDHREETDRLRRKIEAMRAELDERLATESAWPDLPELQDVDALRDRVQNIEKTNEIARAAKSIVGDKERVNGLRKKSQDLTAKIDRLAEEARAAVANSKIPVDGLRIENDVVTLNGIPFDQASDAQQLQTSIAIAMALNPRLRVIRVRDGSLLDKGAMKILQDMATDEDYQVWIERVDDTGDIGFVIEDGRIKGQDIEPTPPKKKASTEAPPTKAKSSKAAAKGGKTLF